MLSVVLFWWCAVLVVCSHFSVSMVGAQCLVSVLLCASRCCSVLVLLGLVCSLASRSWCLVPGVVLGLGGVLSLASHSWCLVPGGVLGLGGVFSLASRSCG